METSTWYLHLVPSGPEYAGYTETMHKTAGERWAIVHRSKWQGNNDETKG